MAGNGHVIVVVGPSNYRSYFKFAKSMDKILGRMAKRDITIITGNGNGSDYVAFLYALRRGLCHVEYEPKRLDFEAAVYRMQERMMEEATGLVTIVDGYDRYVAQAARIASTRNIPRRLLSVKPEQENAKEQKESHGSMRGVNIRTLSRYRERNSHTPFPGVDDR